MQSLTHISSVEATDFGSVDDLINYGIENLGDIDGVINLAGSILLKPAHRTSNEEYEFTIKKIKRFRNVITYLVKITHFLI